MKRRLQDCLQLLGVLFIVGIVYFFVYYLFVNNQANETNQTLYDTITNLIGLFIGTTTIFFIYKTYIAQREEITNNNRNTALNRSIDLVYKQLEFTRQIHINKGTNEYGLLQTHTNIKEKLNILEFINFINANKTHVYDLIKPTRTYLKIINNDIKLFETLIYNDNLQRQEINLLTKIVNENYLNEYLLNVKDLNKVYDINDADYEDMVTANLQANNVAANTDEMLEDYKNYHMEIKEYAFNILTFNIEDKTNKEIQDYINKLNK